MMRMGGDELKKTIPILLLYFFINGLFVLKYVGRTQFSPIAALASYLVFAILLYFSYGFVVRRSGEKTLRILIGILVFIVISVILLLHHFIDPNNLDIDRWSAINNFIQNLFAGIYPYSAQTHLGGYGSPFPAWQFFHVPFYLVGNISLAMLFSVLLVIVALIKYSGNFRSLLLFLLLLSYSPAFWYEAAARSDLFYNFLILLVLLILIYSKQLTIQKNAVLIGLVCGLMLSTRLTVVIPLSIYLFIDFFKADLIHKVIFISMTLSVFAVTFLPFLLWDSESLLFFQYNPFVLQSRQGSFLQLIVLAILLLYFSLKWQNNFIKFNEYTSYVIVFFIAFSFLQRMIEAGFEDSLFSSSFDITYFSMALPFVLFSISYRNIGKVEPASGIYRSDGE